MQQDSEKVSPHVSVLLDSIILLSPFTWYVFFYHRVKSLVNKLTPLLACDEKETWASILYILW